MNYYGFDEIVEGMEESFTVKVTHEMMEAFLGITGDVNPLHTDVSFAKEKGYDSCVVYGMLTASFLSTLAGVYLPGKNSLIHSVETKFVKPVFEGDVLTVSGKVTEKRELFSAFVVKVEIRNQNNEKVLRGNMQIGVMKDGE
ncbi:MAG: MaoC family dehydratase [Lachnospiraceae bacterium]|nr:MaoC family dehydratase [Lachnospiraceae bacterium]